MVLGPPWSPGGFLGPDIWLTSHEGGSSRPPNFAVQRSSEASTLD
jgi:hypothetical protein